MQSLYSFSQSGKLEGVIRDFESNEPLSYVNVAFLNTTLGTQSDSLGIFSLSYKGSESRLVRFSLVGYEARTFQLSSLSGFVEILLKKSENELNEVLVRPGENPAWRIIRLVRKHEPENNPLRYKSFKGKVYTKVKMQFGDVVSKDTARVSGLLKPILADSGSLSQTYLNLFLLENEGEFYFKNGQRKEVVKHSITNLPKLFPANLLVSNEQNPLGFYQPYFRLSLFNQSSDVNSPGIERNYINPLKEGTFSFYDFELTDTLIIERDSIFTIRFEPFRNSPEALKGELKVHSNGYALYEVDVQNTDTIQVLQFRLHQNYRQEAGRWYPIKREVDFVYDYEVKSASAKINLSHYQMLRNLQSEIGEGEIYFDGSNRSIEPHADTITFKEFEKFRFEKLSADEFLTYKRAELNNKPLLQKGLGLLEWPSKVIMQAAAPIGPFLIILDQNLMNFHEFARIGLGLQNNLLEYPRFGFRASAGIGLKDRAWKYRVSASWHITKDRYNRLSVYQVKDIRPPGQVTFLGPNYSTPYPQYLYFNREGYLADAFRQTGVALYTKPIRWTWFRFFGEEERIQPINYTFPENQIQMQRLYRYGVMMRFARKEVFVRNGFFENVQSAYFPIFHLNLSRSDLPKSNTRFYTMSFDISQRLRWKKLGYDLIKLEGGQSWGEVPYNFLFNNLGGGRSFFGLQRQGFVTGNFLQYVSNRYVFLDFVHHFGKNLIKTHSRWFQPQVAIGHRFSYSILDEARSIRGFELSSFRRGQTEVDLYLRNLVVVSVFGFKAGLGLDFAYNYSADFTGKRRWAILPAVVPAFF